MNLFDKICAVPAFILAMLFLPLGVYGILTGRWLPLQLPPLLLILIALCLLRVLAVVPLSVRRKANFVDHTAAVIVFLLGLLAVLLGLVGLLTGRHLKLNVPLGILAFVAWGILRSIWLVWRRLPLTPSRDCERPSSQPWPPRPPEQSARPPHYGEPTQRP